MKVCKVYKVKSVLIVSNFWFLIVFCFAKIFSPLGIAQTSLALRSLVEKILKIAIAIFVSKFLCS